MELESVECMFQKGRSRRSDVIDENVKITLFIQNNMRAFFSMNCAHLFSLISSEVLFYAR